MVVVANKAATIQRRTAESERVRDTIKPVTMLLITLMLATCGSPEPVTSDLAAFGRAQPSPAALPQADAVNLGNRLVMLDRAVKR